MKTIQATSLDALYRRILSDAWANLAQPVREAHGGALVWRGVGLFTIRHGANRLARILVQLLKLPPAGEDITVRLTVTRTKDRERWRREFAGHLFITDQRAGDGDSLIEEFGPTSVCFRLEVSDGALVYHHIKSALRVGPLRIPIAGPLFPRINARESASPNGRGTHVRVTVTHSLIGLLVSYEGHMEGEETMA